MRPKGVAVFKHQKDGNAALQTDWEQRGSIQIPISKKHSEISAPHLTQTATPCSRSPVGLQVVSAGDALRPD